MFLLLISQLQALRRRRISNKRGGFFASDGLTMAQSGPKPIYSVRVDADQNMEAFILEELV